LKRFCYLTSVLLENFSLTLELLIFNYKL
jgi:hypothetical protein